MRHAARCLGGVFTLWLVCSALSGCGTENDLWESWLQENVNYSYQNTARALDSRATHFYRDWVRQVRADAAGPQGGAGAPAR